MRQDKHRHVIDRPGESAERGRRALGQDHAGRRGGHVAIGPVAVDLRGQTSVDLQDVAALRPRDSAGELRGRVAALEGRAMRDRREPGRDHNMVGQDAIGGELAPLAGDLLVRRTAADDGGVRADHRLDAGQHGFLASRRLAAPDDHGTFEVSARGLQRRLYGCRAG